MLKKINVQYIVTTISIAIFSLLTWIIWESDKQNEYESLAKSIHIFFAYSIALVFGIITMVRRLSGHRKTKAAIVQNFIGTFNVIISVLGAIFVYYNSGTLLSAGLVVFLATFCIGLFVLVDIYLDKEVE